MPKHVKNSMFNAGNLVGVPLELRGAIQDPTFEATEMQGTGG